VVVEGVISGNGEEEVPLNIFVLRAPDFLTVFVDDGVLMGVVGDSGGAGWGDEEVGEELSFQGGGERKVGEDGSGWGKGGNDGDGGFSDRWWEVFNRNVSEGDLLNDFFELVVDIFVL
jgi:hypothetical protein